MDVYGILFFKFVFVLIKFSELSLLYFFNDGMGVDFFSIV